jgi:hypothetical protein
VTRIFLLNLPRHAFVPLNALSAHRASKQNLVAFVPTVVVSLCHGPVGQRPSSQRTHRHLCVSLSHMVVLKRPTPSLQPTGPDEPAAELELSCPKLRHSGHNRPTPAWLFWGSFETFPAIPARLECTVQDILSLAAIHQHPDTCGFSAALSISTFHNARCSVIFVSVAYFDTRSSKFGPITIRWHNRPRRYDYQLCGFGLLHCSNDYDDTSFPFSSPNQNPDAIQK